jgi:phosphatidylserine/phosphatidylglycerophosphate/cardiolipin synthase-like enzyme
MFERSRHYRFPWRSGQSFQLLIDGERFFTAMLDSIDGARQFIYLEMYLFESGKIASRFIDALLAASERGVRIYLLLDDYGSRGLGRSDRLRLAGGNIALSLYNPLHYGRWRRNLFRDHRKLLLVDGNIAYTGGAGITDEFDRGSSAQLYWHEAMISVRGSCVCDWQTMFEDNWNRTAEALKMPQFNFADDGKAGQSGRVVESRAITHSEVIRSFVKYIRGANKDIRLASAYFVPSRKIRRALCRRAARGVDVRLLLPGPHSDHPWVRHMGRRYYDKLLRRGVRIFEYQPRFMHMKVLLCDDWVSIGSSNIDRWNFRWNLEANQEVKDSDFALTVQQLFEKDFADSVEIDLEEWRQRPLWVRLNIWYWSIVVSILSWFSFNRKS